MLKFSWKGKQYFNKKLMNNSIYKSKFIIVFMTIIFVIPFCLSCDQTVEMVMVLENFKLSARPSTPTITAVKGLNKLGFGEERDGFLYIPNSYTIDKKMPVIVCIHGAGGSASNWSGFYSWAEEKNVILLSIDSRSYFWDFRSKYGPDVDFIDKALYHTFERVNVDQTKFALVGFSDGASYTISLGATNGNIFSHLIAYSPGKFDEKDPLVGRPKVYISHGNMDDITPIYHSKGNIVPTLISYGYDVTFVEFNGGHEVTDSIITTSLNNWFLEIPESGG